MKLNGVKLGIVFLLLLALALPLVNPGSILAGGNTYYVSPSGFNATGDGTVDHPWRNIQKAINSATDGDIIKVMDDSNAATDDYVEVITVNRSVTIERYDNDDSPPWIRSSSGQDVIRITVDNVKIRGLYIYGATGGPGMGAGIYLDGTSNGISNCIIADNYLGWDNTHRNVLGIMGFFAFVSSNNTISGNTASCSYYTGIFLWSATDTTISGNTANSNADCGIILHTSSHHNTVSGNTANYNVEQGIRLADLSDNNTISGNTANHNKYGVYLDESGNNTISGNTANFNNDTGILLDKLSTDNIVSGNTADSNANFGICLTGESPSGNTVSGNTANHNQMVGIRFLSSDKNTISGNTANFNKDAGIYLHFSDDNIIWGNSANHNDDAGIFLNSSHDNIIWGNTCNFNVKKGIHIFTSGNNTIRLNNFDGNTQYGINVDPSGIDGPLDAEYNWWGDASGPYDPDGNVEVPPCNDDPANDRNADGQGDTASDNLDYCPWLEAQVIEARCKVVTDSDTFKDTATGGDIDVNATGERAVCTARYGGDPYGGHSFKTATRYYDVYLDDDTGVNSLTIKFCPATSDTCIYYWNGVDWSPVSAQYYSDGCIVVTVTAATSPSLADLAGLPFALTTPIPVGGEIYPVNKLYVTAPLLAVIGAIILTSTIWLGHNRTRTKK